MKTTKFAIWSIAALIATGFTACEKDDIEIAEPHITLTTTKKVGEKISLKINAADADKVDVWIDLNYNNKKDHGEDVTSFGSQEEYTLSKKSVTIYGKVTELYCNNNRLTALKVSKDTVLKSLYCSDNQLKALDVSKNNVLEEMECNGNQLTGLNVSKNTALWLLGCGGNPIKTLDVSKNTALIVLGCSDNLLTELDVSKNTELEYLHCFNNQLKALDVSKNTALEYLHCYNNKIFGDKMDTLVNSLPNRTTSSDEGNFYVINIGAGEGNICTRKQVYIAKNKNWKVMDSQGNPYLGSK